MTLSRVLFGKAARGPRVHTARARPGACVCTHLQPTARAACILRSEVGSLLNKTMLFEMFSAVYF